MSLSFFVLALAFGFQQPVGPSPPAAERELLGRRCDAGAAEACRTLGGLLCDGPWWERDYYGALKLFDRGCQLGDAKSCLSQALMLERRQGQAVARRDVIEALYEKACAAGDVHGCYLSGQEYLPSKEAPRDGDVKDLGRALALFDRACTARDEEACNRLARIYGQGENGVTIDAPRAAEYYRKACDAGDEGCAGLGIAYAKGDGLPKDEARASALYARVLEARSKSCAAGDAADCFRLGAGHREGNLGALKDPARAAFFLQKACDLGYAHACGQLASMLDGTQGGVSRDPTHAQELRKRAAEVHERLCDKGAFTECWLAQSPRAQYQACEHGDPEACYRLGRSYLDGDLGDFPRAAHFYEKGCDLGDGGLCTLVADLYAEGRGVSRNPQRAVALYEKACGLGDAQGCLNLGDRAAKSSGGPANLEAAAAFYAKACDRGSGVGCRKRGDALRGGIGVARDPTQATAAYRKACDKHFLEACHELALLLRSGTGVARDETQAAKLTRDACQYLHAMGDAQPPSCRDACDRGDAAICALIGRQDRAEKLYGQECDSGGVASCHALAKMLLRGKLSGGTRRRVTTLLDKACQGGLGEACVELGRLVVHDDAARALQCYERACNAGDAAGCRTASDLLTVGATGVPVNRERAAALAQRARALSEKRKQ